MNFPELVCKIAFTSDFSDVPVWTDVTDYFLSMNDHKRGRENPIEVCDPTEATFQFRNDDGEWDPDDSTGPWYGHLRPNKLIRLSVVHEAVTYHLFTGYIDSIRRVWPEDSDHSLCEIEATDRFKQLARSTVTADQPEETATARLGTILTDVAYKTLNIDAYAARTLVAQEYAGDSVLQSAQDAAKDDGGLLFVDTSGTVVFQSYAFRSNNTRATISQATFGNTDIAIPINGDDLVPSVDDAVMANLIRLTDGHGVQHTLDDPAAALVDGLLELDLGSTGLADTGTQIADRLAEVLALFIDAKPRWDSITLNCITDELALEQAVSREISDKITIEFRHPGLAGGTAREQFIESVSHDIALGENPHWFCTFGLSSMPGDASVGRTDL